MNIYVDMGNFTTIARCENGEITIPTLLRESTDRVYQGAFIIDEYQGLPYVVGDLNASKNVNINLSKMDLPHKLTMLTAVHQLVENKQHINLYIGMPIKSYYNIPHREEYCEFMNDEEVTLTINNETKTFYIDSITALPESVGYIFLNPSDQPIGVIDIGHTTIDAGVFKNGMPIMESIFTENKGADKLKTQVKSELNNKLLLNIQDYQIDDIIDHGMYGKHHDAADEIINQCYRQYMSDIVHMMVKHDWEIDSLPVVWTGGGANIIKNVVNQVDTFIASDNACYDNIDGFQELGVLVHGN